MALEEEILIELRDSRIAEQKDTLVLLHFATRDGGGDRRTTLCTSRILASLRTVLLSHHLSLQYHTSVSLLNLSFHLPNLSNIVYAEVVLTLVDVLKGGAVDAYNHSVVAPFSLSMDDNNNKATHAFGEVYEAMMEAGAGRY
ncbi:hypothetical protein Taro_005979, partial [Colocasia esculenta]|nr:hypothetical protein [Colocasia esculenta]